MKSLFASETDPRVADLRGRLIEFYQAPVKYDDFDQEVAELVDFWPAIMEEMKARVAVMADNAGKGKIRLLEFGAGRTGFGDHLGALRDKVDFDVQDVTRKNIEQLEAQADRVHICDLAELKGPYDVIMSTFAYEHISNPRATLEHLFTMLAPGGTMFIAAPRYGFPLYMPPSGRHYGKLKRTRVMTWLLGQRLLARIDRRPRFYIHLDPAMFRIPWYRDADAVHWVSILDFSLVAPRGYKVRRVRLNTTGWNWKRKVWESLLLAYVRIDRDPN